MASNIVELMEHVHDIQNRLDRIERERNATCYRCNEKGHYASTCSKKIDQPLTCFRCHEPGHFVASCPKPSVCYSCQEPGHFAASCPKKDDACSMIPEASDVQTAASQTDSDIELLEFVAASENKPKKRKRSKKACNVCPKEPECKQAVKKRKSSNKEQ